LQSKIDVVVDFTNPDLVFENTKLILEKILNQIKKYKIKITVKNPIEFFSAPIAGRFPLTTFAVVLRVIGLFVGTLLVYSFIEHKYFTKAFLLVCVLPDKLFVFSCSAFFRFYVKPEPDQPEK